MKVTLDHPESKHGYPVILDDNGTVMPVDKGIETALNRVGVSYEQFAAYCDILPPTLRQYGRRCNAPANVLNMIGLILDDPKRIGDHVTKGAMALTDMESQVLTMTGAGLTYSQIAAAMSNNRKNKMTRQRAFQIAEAARGKLDMPKGEPMAKPKKTKKKGSK